MSNEALGENSSVGSPLPLQEPEKLELSDLEGVVSPSQTSLPSLSPRGSKRTRSPSPSRVRESKSRSARELLGGVGSVPASFLREAALVEEDPLPPNLTLKQLEEMRALLMCLKCHEVMKRPHELSCKHNFCSVCLPIDGLCPMCQTKCSMATPVFSMTRFIPYLFPYRCPRCLQEGPYTAKEHRDLCPRSRRCVFEGCGLKLFEEEESAHALLCQHRLVPCVGCAQVVSSVKLPEHHASCERVVLCCGRAFARETYSTDHNDGLGTFRDGKFAVCKRFEDASPCTECAAPHPSRVSCRTSQCRFCKIALSPDFLSTHEQLCPKLAIDCSLCASLYSGAGGVPVSRDNVASHEQVYHNFAAPFVALTSDPVELSSLLQCFLLSRHRSELCRNSSQKKSLFSFAKPLALPHSTPEYALYAQQSGVTAVSLSKTPESPTSFDLGLYQPDDGILTPLHSKSESVDLVGVHLSSYSLKLVFSFRRHRVLAFNDVPASSTFLQLLRRESSVVSEKVMPAPQSKAFKEREIVVLDFEREALLSLTTLLNQAEAAECVYGFYEAGTPIELQVNAAVAKKDRMTTLAACFPFKS